MHHVHRRRLRVEDDRHLILDPAPPLPSVGTRAAFTLIELLVVIAIIAVLAAILFPVFAQARDKARQTACISNMKQIGTATVGYTQDYDEVLPMPGYVISGVMYSYDTVLSPYMGFKVDASGSKPALIWACPNDNEERIGGRLARSYSLVLTRVNPCGVPACTGPAIINATTVAGYAGAGGKNDNDGQDTVGRPLAEITAPGSTFYMAETRNMGDNQGNVYGGSVFYPLYTSSAPSWADNSQNFVPKAIGGPKVIIEPTHAGGWNYLYCDAHVKWSKPQSTLGRNPATGAPNTNLASPRGPWTVWEGDD